MSRKVFRTLITLLLSLLLFMPSLMAQKEVFIRKIDFELTSISSNDYENEFFLTLQFNKGTIYKYKIMNAIGGARGKAVVEIYDGSKLVGTNSLGDKYFDQFAFQCNKTGFYDIILKFKDNQLGNSAVNIYMVQ
ncbi:MAG: hypothetical protein ACOC2F_08375 [Bacteroidota bacterium]